MSRRKEVRNKRRGMAMATVIFAMAIVMLLSTLVTTNALLTRTGVIVSESNFKQRNRLSQVGEYFVADVMACRTTYQTATNVNEIASSVNQSLTAAFDKYVYKYQVDASVAQEDATATVFRLSVYTLEDSVEDTADNASLRSYLMYLSVQETPTADGYTYTVVEWSYCK